MNTELKEKMKGAAEDFFPSFVFGAGEQADNKAARFGFEKGATAMYAELAPLVEWVSVEDRLPKYYGNFLVKVGKTKFQEVLVAYYDEYKQEFSCNFCDHLFANEHITHWRKIEI